MDYESRRLSFMNREAAEIGDTDSGREDINMMAQGENWGAYVSKVDIGSVFETMQTDQPLGRELINKLAVVLVRHKSSSYQAYTTDVWRIPDLTSLPFLLPTA